MTKNLNLKVDDSLFFEFHRLKGLLKAGTNQACLRKLLQIADEKMKEMKTVSEKDQYLKILDDHNTLITEQS